MNYSIKTYPAFDKELKRLAKRYKSLKDDVRRLAVDLLANPTQGVDLGGGMRKVRMSIEKGIKKADGYGFVRMNLHLSAFFYIISPM